MGEGAQGRMARKDEARPGATPGEFRQRNCSGLDLYWRSAAIRVSGRVRSLDKAPGNATHRSFRPETLRHPTADLRLILCISPEYQSRSCIPQRKESTHDQSGSA